MTDKQLKPTDIIDKTKERFTSIAPANLAFDAEKGFAIQLITANTRLAAAAMEAPDSLAQAVTNIAAIGLSLNPARKEAYLITRNMNMGKDENGKTIYQNRICLDPSYMGLCNLATNSGMIEWIQANTVHKDDKFMDNGPGLAPTHSYDPFGDRGEFIGVYCVAKTKSGDFLTTIMTKKEIDDIKGRSESGKRGYGPWHTDYNEMAKKTVARRAFKMWPKAPALERMAEAVEISNQNEGFEPILTDPASEVKGGTDQKQYLDQMIVESDALGMYVLRTTIDYGEWTNLYHSFEHGAKGKNQQAMEALAASGGEIYQEMVNNIIKGVTSGDDALIFETYSELSQDAWELVKKELAPATINEINKVVSEVGDE